MAIAGRMALQPLKKVAAIDSAYEITYLANFGEIPSNHRG